MSPAATGAADAGMACFMIMPVQAVPLSQLALRPYVVVGCGGFTRQLLQLLGKRGLPLPQAIVNPNPSAPAAFESIPVWGLEHSLPESWVVVPGSDVFQPQLLERIRTSALAQAPVWDVSDAVQAFTQQQPEVWLPREPTSSRYLVLSCVGHSVPLGCWLNNFKCWLKRRQIELVVRHPLDPASDTFWRQACGILAWNGSSSLFTPLKTQLQRLNVPLTYAECGFFPQLSHFYFDRQGVNLASQLRSDDLSWLNESHHQLYLQRRRALFGELEIDDQGYLFVPLQIESDSNIQLYSTFKQGMQEYIDWVAEQEPKRPILFKPHPKDPQPHRYKMPTHGQLVFEDTLDLIAHSHRVRGITSSVLFEAALLGKPVRCDGQSLLNHPEATPVQVVTALIARQFHRDETEFDGERLTRFTHFNLD
ncbi:hypothetical protein [Celerinatantimonas sp. YJH-8]|uniref:capsular polysaccharide export protein, LipB/KpsS family n=1 Tax=Celerinatantimonas sp. YJH-8 TaxID=3228714 RepID=UPI0038C4902B